MNTPVTAETPRRVEGVQAMRARRLARLLEIDERGVGGEADALRRHLTERAQRILERAGTPEQKKRDLVYLAVDAKRILADFVNQEKYGAGTWGQIRQGMDSAGGKALVGAIEVGISATGVASVGSGFLWAKGVRLLTEAVKQWRSGKGEHRLALDEPDEEFAAGIERALADSKMLAGKRTTEGVATMLKAVVDGVFKSQFQRLLTEENAVTNQAHAPDQRELGDKLKQGFPTVAKRVFGLLAFSPMDMDEVPELVGHAVSGQAGAHFVTGTAYWQGFLNLRPWGSALIRDASLPWQLASAGVNLGSGLAGFAAGDWLSKKWAKGERVLLDTSWVDMSAPPPAEQPRTASTLATPGRRREGSLLDFAPYLVPDRVEPPRLAYAEAIDGDDEHRRTTSPSRETATGKLATKPSSTAPAGQAPKPSRTDSRFEAPAASERTDETAPSAPRTREATPRPERAVEPDRTDEATERDQQRERLQQIVREAQATSQPTLHAYVERLLDGKELDKLWLGRPPQLELALGQKNQRPPWEAWFAKMTGQIEYERRRYAPAPEAVPGGRVDARPTPDTSGDDEAAINVRFHTEADRISQLRRIIGQYRALLAINPATAAGFDELPTELAKRLDQFEARLDNAHNAWTATLEGPADELAEDEAGTETEAEDGAGAVGDERAPTAESEPPPLALERSLADLDELRGIAGDTDLSDKERTARLKSYFEKSIAKSGQLEPVAALQALMSGDPPVVRFTLTDEAGQRWQLAEVSFEPEYRKKLPGKQLLTGREAASVQSMIAATEAAPSNPAALGEAIALLHRLLAESAEPERWSNRLLATKRSGGTFVPNEVKPVINDALNATEPELLPATLGLLTGLASLDAADLPRVLSAHRTGSTGPEGRRRDLYWKTAFQALRTYVDELLAQQAARQRRSEALPVDPTAIEALTELRDRLTPVLKQTIDQVGKNLTQHPVLQASFAPLGESRPVPEQLTNAKLDELLKSRRSPKYELRVEVND